MLTRWKMGFVALLIQGGLYAQTTQIEQQVVWVNEAIVSVYTYSFSDFTARQKAIAHYFTAAGWISFSDALNKSHLIDDVKKNQYVVSAVATAPPVITALQPGYWKAVMPTLVAYKNPQYQQTQTLEVTLEFKTSTAGEGERGFAITSIHTTVITPACKCPNP